jgi:hypothetical protein
MHWHTFVTQQGTNNELPADDTLSVETCRSSTIICELIVRLLVIVQNNKRCRLQVLK